MPPTTRNSKRKAQVIDLEESTISEEPPKKQLKEEKEQENQEKEDIMCGICFETPQIRGKLDSCEHPYCFTCIQTWSKTANTCPFCKTRFHEITKLDPSSKAKKPRKVKVKHRDQRPEMVDPRFWQLDDDSDDEDYNEVSYNPMAVALSIDLLHGFRSQHWYFPDDQLEHLISYYHSIEDFNSHPRDHHQAFIDLTVADEVLEDDTDDPSTFAPTVTQIPPVLPTQPNTQHQQPQPQQPLQSLNNLGRQYRPR
eukprot:TRINITY_DN3316_c0_g1_i2.p1 TRINITY_DN3316_c0_g1~~TRINITY_DN3316_c0_g1_i2.p1  ORF type:complete len:253 (-),score=40.70 TRINITY_DN3316_c0_g1_i2:56-814(-)